LKLFRPFPVKHLREAFSKAKLVVVFDRDIGYGHEGILAYELKAALYPSEHRPIIRGFIVGLGGRDITPEDLIGGVKKAVSEKDDRNVQLATHTDFIGLKLDQLGFKKGGN